MQSTAYGFTCVRCAVCDVLWPSSSPPRSPFLRRRRRRRSFQLSFFSHIHRYGVPAHPLRLPPRLILRAPIYRSPFRLSSSAQRSRACAPRRAQPGPIGQFLRGRAGCLRLPGNRWRRPCRPFFLPLFSFFFLPPANGSGAAAAASAAAQLGRLVGGNWQRRCGAEKGWGGRQEGQYVLLDDLVRHTTTKHHRLFLLLRARRGPDSLATFRSLHSTTQTDNPLSSRSLHRRSPSTYRPQKPYRTSPQSRIAQTQRLFALFPTQLIPPVHPISRYSYTFPLPSHTIGCPSIA